MIPQDCRFRLWYAAVWTDESGHECRVVIPSPACREEQWTRRWLERFFERLDRERGEAPTAVNRYSLTMWGWIEWTDSDGTTCRATVPDACRLDRHQKVWATKFFAGRMDDVFREAGR